mmetsp:Transcript_125625/g.287805  ORF Transcript_125625/g.287805 Transcript_125625/m.287805 type:complete len:174 (-) Transcript_125625:209-730(-)
MFRISRRVASGGWCSMRQDDGDKDTGQQQGLPGDDFSFDLKAAPVDQARRRTPVEARPLSGTPHRVEPWQGGKLGEPGAEGVRMRPVWGDPGMDWKSKSREEVSTESIIQALSVTGKITALEANNTDSTRTPTFGVRSAQFGAGIISDDREKLVASPRKHCCWYRIFGRGSWQ